MPSKRSSSRSNRDFIAILFVVLVAGIGTLTYVSTRPEPQARVLDPNAPLPSPHGHVIGSDSAPVEIVMFADFECPGCGQFATVTEPDVRTRIVQTGLARFRFVDFPLQGHPNTMVAHNAAACAGAQGKFWEMHDELYRQQFNWSALAGGKDADDPADAMKSYARDLGLDSRAFDSCLDSRQFEPQILANAREGRRIGVRGTPTFLVGKWVLPAGAQPYDVIKLMVDSATAEARRSNTRPPAFGDTTHAASTASTAVPR